MPQGRPAERIPLYWFDAPRRNFGDDLNLALWPRLLPNLVDTRSPVAVGSRPDPLPESLFVGVGTLLNDRLPPVRRLVVLGSGVGYGGSVTADASWDVRAVRGPLTATAIGCDPSRAVTDAALLLLPAGLLPARRPGPTVGFAPHHAWERGLPWKAMCRHADVTLIRPTDPVPTVMEAVSRCSTVVCGALHVAVVADVLGVPWVPFAPAAFPHDKWLDWCDSIDVPYRPFAGPAVSGGSGRRAAVANAAMAARLAEAMRKARGAAESRAVHSDRGLLADRIEQLVREVDRLRVEH